MACKRLRSPVQAYREQALGTESPVAVDPAQAQCEQARPASPELAHGAPVEGEADAPGASPSGEALLALHVPHVDPAVAAARAPHAHSGDALAHRCGGRPAYRANRAWDRTPVVPGGASQPAPQQDRGAPVAASHAIGEPTAVESERPLPGAVVRADPEARNRPRLTGEAGDEKPAPRHPR